MSDIFAADCLNGRTALVTGASSGIGAACARRLAGSGATVVVTGRDSRRLEKIAAEFPGRCIVLPQDLGSPDGAELLAAEVKSSVGAVDLLVNSAGYGDITSSARLTGKSIDSVFAVNVRAPLLLCSRLVPGMIENGRGAIINISSVVASVGTPYQAAYSATKGALESMTRALAREYGAAGIRVNAVAAGLIATEMWGERLADEALVNAAAQYTALGSWGKPEMIADAVLFLGSDAACYITGQTLFVDGGLVNTGNLVPPSSFGKPKKS
jgi:NAD(P)-dependent dehydrogenase (short-subunit alcohol dehydrogenase family)